MINKNEAIKNNIKVVDNSIKNELFENLKTNFPQTIIEGKADLKAISLLLGLDKNRIFRAMSLLGRERDFQTLFIVRLVIKN